MLRQVLAILFIILFGTSSNVAGAVIIPDYITPLYPSKTPQKVAQTPEGPAWGAYMRELQRRIKMNWIPPKNSEKQRVVLLFAIRKDGSLESKDIKVLKSSGDLKCDDAAIQSVILAVPFRPLPAEFKGEKIDIQFTFDSNFAGASIK